MNDLKLKKAVVSVVERDIAEEKLYGAAVRVSLKGKMVLSEDIGVQKDNLFYLASMTKPVTAVAVLVERERGRLNLEDPVKKYLPAFADMYIGRVENDRAVPDRKAETTITIRHLMTHTSGILSAKLGEVYFPEVNSHRTTLENAVNYYPQTLLAFEPDSQMNYSPIAAFDIAARIVELVSGMPYDEYLNKNVFDPLGIRNMGYFPASERRARLVPMHSRDESGHSYTVEQVGGIRDMPDTYFCAGGGLAGSADEYAKFAKMLLCEGKGLLKPESVELMRTANPHGWGLSVRVLKNNQYLPDGCFGWSGSLGTHFWVDPGKGLYAIYMKNSLHDGGAGATTAREFEKAVMQGLAF
jgi:CubicO group peptidase (beta-lactamase class C family)